MSKPANTLILRTTKQICDALCAAGVTRKELGRRLGISQPAVTMMLNERNLTLRTVADVFHALGMEVEITVRPMMAGEVEAVRPEPVVSLPKAINVQAVGDMLAEWRRMLSCTNCNGTGYAMYYPGGMLPCHKCNAKGGEAGR